MSNILIVGANRGIGYYLVNRLLEKGDKVCVLDIQIDQIEELNKILSKDPKYYVLPDNGRYKHIF